ncbi:MAG: cytochrome P450 [Cyanobacteriota bacterium]|nr:cytochrome P450 [Cyanobacteriota bacterium]
MPAAIPSLAVSPRRQVLQAIVDPIGYHRRCFTAHNGAVRVSMSPTLPPQQVLINDPLVLQELINRDTGRGLSAPGRLNQLLAQVVGERSILMLEPTPHRARRRLLTPPFQGGRLKAYGTLIQRLSSEVLADLTPGHSFDARERMQRITMRVILSAVFGLHEGERYRRLEALLHRSLDLRAGRLGSLLLFVPLLRRDAGPWSPGGRLRRLEGESQALLLREIGERRQALAAAADPERVDVLSLLLACRDEQGQGLSDAELHDELLTLLLAGHETTATALTWALHWIHRQSEVRQRLLAELAACPDPSDPEQVSRLPYLGAVVNEVLRIHPVAMLMFPRLVEEPLELAGRSFEAGDVLIGCIQAVHERPDLYPDPLRFDPERFLERSYGPGEFLPFGGGARRCLGAALAVYEMKLILATLLQRFTLALTPAADRPLPPRRRGFTLGPSRPVRLRVAAAAPTAPR